MRTRMPWTEAGLNLPRRDKLCRRLQRNQAKTTPIHGRTKHIVRTCQATPGSIQAEVGLELEKNRKMSQAGRAAHPGQTKPNPSPANAGPKINQRKP